MKTMLTPLLFLLPSFLWAQTIDSTAIKQVDSLIQVSRTLTAKQKFDEALEVNAAAELLALKNMGHESAAYGSCCFNRGRVNWRKRNYPEAEKWYLEGKAIRERTLGKEHPDYAHSLNNLGRLYNDMGNSEKAEPLLFEALSVREKALGKGHPLYAQTLLNLGLFYRNLGNVKKAELLHLEAVAILEKALGKNHPLYASYLYALGNLYWGMGNYEKAEPIYLEVIAIVEKTFDQEKIEYGFYLNNLASVYFEMGNNEKAEPLFLKSLAFFEKILGKEHLYYAFVQENLGALFMEMGKYEKAEPLLLNSRAIVEKTYGKEHYINEEGLMRMALLYENQRRFSESETLMTEKFALEQARLSKLMSFLSEWELAQYFSNLNYNYYQKRFDDDLNGYILARQEAGVHTGTLPALAYGYALFYKGFLLNVATRLNKLSATSPASMEIRDRLKMYRRQLAAEYARPIAERIGLAELEAIATATETELARSVEGYSQAIQLVKWDEVRAVLKKGEAAIEFVHFQTHFPQKTDSTMYAALLLRPDEEQPKFIPLFEEKSLDSLLQTLGERKADYVNSLYTVAERGAKPLGKPQKSLYELLWQPLEKELENVQTVYFSPSGLLHRLNLGAVPISDEETLADRYNLVTLGSTRQLVVGSQQLAVGSQSADLFGGVQYEMDSTAIVAANAYYTNDYLASRGGLSFSNADSTLRGGTWNYLKWTDKEVAALEPILEFGGIETTTRRGFGATEEALKAIGRGKSSPKILHIATHGFFFPDPKSVGSRLSTIGSEEPVFKMSEDPMIRSGLILAGGNYAWQTGKPLQPGMDDGILTAYEISQMNLSNTELVVLSACETGLGDIQGNEGVYGLQRAFKIAGAKYLVMSLWQVPDQETSIFMTAFYRHFVEGEMGIPESFRTTQKEMRERFINPYQWAGFVLVE